MAIKTDMLRYFVEVAQTGNLTRAAENLGRTPSAVSMMLKQFEEHVGAPLFETDRKNKLTAVGRFALVEAENELDHFDQTVSSILRYAESGEGSIRIASIPTIASSLLPKIIQEIHEDNPKSMLDVSEMLTGPILAAITSGAADIGIVNDYIKSGFPTVNSERFVSDKLGILCLRDSVIGRKDTLYWSDIAGTHLIDNGICKSVEEPAVQKALADSRVQARSTSQYALVSAGVGVVVAPALGCKNLAQNLVFRIPEGEPHRRDVYMVWSNTADQSPRIEFLREKLLAAGAEAEK